MELFVVYFLLAIGVGALASSRGRSGLGYFLLSMLLSPLLGLIVVLVTSDLAEQAKKERLRREDHERQVESIKALAARAPVTQPTNASGPSKSVADELAKLAELRDKGVL